MKNSKIIWASEILSIILLIGSFPVKSICGDLPSDIMRVIGLAFLFIFLVLRLIDQKKH